MIHWEHTHYNSRVLVIKFIWTFYSTGIKYGISKLWQILMNAFKIKLHVNFSNEKKKKTPELMLLSSSVCIIKYTDGVFCAEGLFEREV